MNQNWRSHLRGLRKMKLKVFTEFGKLYVRRQKRRNRRCWRICPSRIGPTKLPESLDGHRRYEGWIRRVCGWTPHRTVEQDSSRTSLTKRVSINKNGSRWIKKGSLTEPFFIGIIFWRMKTNVY